MEILKTHFYRQVAAALLLCFAGRPLRADSVAAPAGYEAVYAAFVVNLARFIEWPATCFPSEEAPLVIGTFARDPLNETLDAYVRKERIANHPIRTVRIRSVEDVQACHIIYFSRTYTSQASAALGQIRGRPVLAVTDAEGALQLGAHVVLISSPRNTRLRIDLANLKQSNLAASSQLLRLAELTGR